ncbi:hypothetical protein GCM10022405_46180 [Gibbsiella dentisursi]|uniref:Uncharacterized protein n=1 Tax=Gibbsiella dentisursi TaxID=796890 RepID=A0ABP7M5X5_9GAMM
MDYNGKEDSPYTAAVFWMRKKKWKAYRDELCLSVATELDEDSYDYQSYIDQCQINLNNNHANEIAQMGLPPAN